MEQLLDDDWVRRVGQAESDLQQDEVSAGLNLDTHFAEYVERLKSGGDALSS
ncbi:hypothetical protein [Gloeobacter violaceus]|uniref:hypothetical protein n=1 Tax=Gloeobacter violaceus TaxID=33072 RepID=UPI0013E8E8A8|nr:hypothetical protein [Gloeobacter violaceus]